jgi:hypothetical protein
MHHGMFVDLQANCPPAILSCSSCAPRTVRLDPSITDNELLFASASDSVAPENTRTTVELPSVAMCTTTEHRRQPPLAANERCNTGPEVWSVESLLQNSISIHNVLSHFVAPLCSPATTPATYLVVLYADPIDVSRRSPDYPSSP